MKPVGKVFRITGREEEVFAKLKDEGFNCWEGKYLTHISYYVEGQGWHPIASYNGKKELSAGNKLQFTGSFLYTGTVPAAEEGKKKLERILSSME